MARVAGDYRLLPCSGGLAGRGLLRCQPTGPGVQRAVRAPSGRVDDAHLCSGGGAGGGAGGAAADWARGSGKCHLSALLITTHRGWLPRTDMCVCVCPGPAGPLGEENGGEAEDT